MKRSSYRGMPRILLCLAIFALLWACSDGNSASKQTGAKRHELVWDQGNWDESNWQ